MLDSVTRKRIDNCRDILVGKLPSPSAQVEQITIALIYKFMDDMDRVTVEEYGGNPTFFKGDFEKYSWQNIYSPRTDAHQMLNLYGEGIQKMGQNPGLNPMFRSIFKDAFLPYRDPETLRLFLSTINEFSYEHSEMLGDAFEYLLSIMGSQGDAGQFRTPRHIIDFLVELVDPKIGETILDPACGTSGFLISAYKHILNSNKKDKPGDLLSSTQKKELLESINGYDISPDMVRLSSANLFLHGFTDDELNIHEYDTLSSEDRWNEYYDVIIANPPFMTPKGGIRPHNRFSVDSNRAEVLFTNYIMEHLTPKGRAGIVVPEGIIFQSGKAYKQLRKALVEKYLIGVISLPSGVFNPYSGVKTSILILDKELSQKTDKIFFGKVENDGFDLGAQRRQIDKNDLPRIKDDVLKYINNLKVGDDSENTNLSFVTKDELISSNDIGLSFERYNNELSVSQKWEMIELGKVCDLIRGITFSKKDQLNEKATNSVSVITTKAAQSTGVNYDDVYFVPRDVVKNEEKYLLEEDILISTANSLSQLGRATYIDNKIQPYTSFGAFMSCIRVKEDISPKYLFYLISSKYAREYFVSVARTTTNISNLNFSDLEMFNIPLPPLEIQNKIVEELEQYQKVLDGAKQVVDNYKPHIDIDESWEVKKLVEVAEVIAGQSPKSENYNTKGEGLPFYQGRTDFGDLYLQTTNKHTTQITKISRLGDIVMSVRAPVGPVNLTPFEICIGRGLCAIRPKNKILVKYLLYYLMSNQKIIKGNSGAIFDSINRKQVEELPISIPSIEIQKAIVQRVEDEESIVQGNKKLIEIYTQKIEDRINKIWGE